ncbi:RNA polymerase II C-terminal domain phosphatase-like 4 [Argentina anserina]|uniref:RNA polymerase II C-terminal domain phosphatase-like 4 n=1 Tax=Argentina anserina TaxID=57926 RepID=UPI002176480A|nr:RNA polymerase II C-terminal domain phosphatase-like 4 [Potentilla anserina]
MMSVDVVSPILNNIDNLHGSYLKRARAFDFDYFDLGFLDQRPKRFKGLETDLGVKPMPSDFRFGYVPKGVALKDDEIERLRNKNTNRLLNRKKLHLVLDLDHTLLNTASFDDLSPDEEYLRTQTQSAHGLQYVNIVDAQQIVTKIRPFIRNFLVQADLMFELSIYTMGAREYALEMVKLLDPGNVLFGGRIISRSESTVPDRKSLDALLARDSAVVILDDTKNVWTGEDKENVIVVPRYHFFRASRQKFGLGDGKSYAELNSDEPRDSSYLANVLQVLRDVHTRFFDEAELQGCDIIDRDVRSVLKSRKKEVLKGCKIVFSHVIPLGVKAETHPLWKMAEQLGATCTTEADASVTHVVAADARTQKSYWAVSAGKFLVNPQWIHTSNFTWQKEPEKDFPCH